MKISFDISSPEGTLPAEENRQIYQTYSESTGTRMNFIIPLVAILSIQTLPVTSHVIQVDLTRITCWTCRHKANNMECNDWAPDRFCPIGSSVCQSVHSFHGATGESIRVDKRCVSQKMCQPDTVGCTFDPDNQINTCISCCSTPYCNEEVAHDNHTAIKLSVTVMESSGCNIASHWLILVLSLSMMNTLL